MINTRKIDNGVIISYRNAEGRNEEKAFLFENTSWLSEAKTLVSEIKSVVANRIEFEAQNQLDNIADNLETPTTE